MKAKEQIRKRSDRKDSNTRERQALSPLSTSKQQRDQEMSIAEAVVEAAARNGGCGKEMMALLLQGHGPLTEEIIRATAEHFDKAMMTLLLQERSQDIRVTEEVVEAAATNW